MISQSEETQDPSPKTLPGSWRLTMVRSLWIQVTISVRRSEADSPQRLGAGQLHSQGRGTFIQNAGWVLKESGLIVWGQNQ